MIEKSPTGGGQLDAMHAASDQLGADFLFKRTDLSTKRRLRGVQPLPSRERQAALLGDRDEIAKVTELHSAFP